MDLDGDGLLDVLSGAHHGEIYLFRGLRGGKFAPGEELTNSRGKPVKTVFGSTVCAVDWDADGDLDLLLGSSDGDVHLARNEGSRREYSFGEPEKLAAGGQPIQVPKGNSCPAAADWDGDGRLDLVVGADDGSVLLFRNLGTASEPKLAEGETLVPPPEEGSDRGTRAKICVADWNDDGCLDVILGDHGGEFEKELSEEEKQWREEAHRQQAELLSSWAAVFGDYRRLLQTPEPEQPELRQKREEELASLRERLQLIKRIRDKYYREEEALKPGKQYHGRVWVFLGRKPKT